MIKKIYLSTYLCDKRLKKFRLEEGEYSIGNDRDKCDIFLDEDCLEKCLKVIIDTHLNIHLVIASNHKKLLLNNSKISLSDEKVQIKNKDIITFRNSNISIKFKIKEKSRERSRSKEQIKQKVTETLKEEKKEKPKEESSNQNTGYIKSEVIWNSVQFEDEKRKEKFLKLMGAKKKNQTDGSTSKLDKKESEKLQNNFQKIESDLTKQYYNALGRKPPI